MRTSVQRLAALGLIVRAVPAPSSRRWGWTDATTGKRRGSRRSTVYTLTGDASREARTLATIGADVEPSPEITAAVARVEAAHAAALARLDAPASPELVWCGVEAVDLAVDLVLADDAVDLAVADVEAPAVAELELSPLAAPERVDLTAAPVVAPIVEGATAFLMTSVEAVAVVAAPYPSGPFVSPFDRQRLPSKRPGRTQSARARATAPGPSPAAPPWLALSAAAVARAQIPRSPVRAVEPPRPAMPRPDAAVPPGDVAEPSQRAPDGLPPELLQRLRGLVSRRR